MNPHNKNNIMLLRIPCAMIRDLSHPLHLCPPTTLKSIQSLLLAEGGYNVCFCDTWVQQYSLSQLYSDIESLSIDIIVLVIDRFARNENKDFIKYVKQHFSCCVIGIGEGAEDLGDMYFLGEAEFEVFQRIKQLNKSSLEEVICDYTQNYENKTCLEIPSLDDLPLMQWSPEESEKYPVIYPLKTLRKSIPGYLTTSRGCPYQCIFCSSSVRKSYGNAIRLMSQQCMRNHLQYLVELGVNTIYFEDENITVNRDHILRICEEILSKGYSIDWVAHARIDTVDKEVLSQMKKAGCKLLLFGVESGSPRIIELLKKTHDAMNWNSLAQEVFSHTRSIGIGSCALFMVGSPTETKEEVDMSIELAKSLRPDLIKVHFFTPYPGSEVFQQYKDSISLSDLHNIHHYTKPKINLSNMSEEVLQRKQKEFYKKVLFNPTFLWRHMRDYAGFYVHNWNITKKLLLSTWRLFRG